jgi:hypothetical protein
MITGAVSLEVAKACHTVWVKGLFYKLIILTFCLSWGKERPDFFTAERSKLPLSATSTRRGMRVGVAWGGLVSALLFSLYVHDMSVRFRYVEQTVLG